MWPYSNMWQYSDMWPYSNMCRYSDMWPYSNMCQYSYVTVLKYVAVLRYVALLRYVAVLRYVALHKYVAVLRFFTVICRLYIWPFFGGRGDWLLWWGTGRLSPVVGEWETDSCCWWGMGRLSCCWWGTGRLSPGVGGELGGISCRNPKLLLAPVVKISADTLFSFYFFFYKKVILSGWGPACFWCEQLFIIFNCI